MVYGRYNYIDDYISIDNYIYIVHGAFKPTYNWGAPSCTEVSTQDPHRDPNHSLSPRLRWRLPPIPAADNAPAALRAVAAHDGPRQIQFSAGWL